MNARTKQAIVVGGLVAVIGTVLYVRSRVREDGAAPPPTAPSSGAGPVVGGVSHIGFTLERDGKTRRTTSGERVERGDIIHFVVTSREPLWLAILSWSESQHAKVHYASTGPTAPSNAEQPIPVTYKVDGNAGREVFWGLLCPDKVDAAALKAQLDKDGEKFVTPLECQRSTWTLQDGTP